MVSTRRFIYVASLELLAGAGYLLLITRNPSTGSWLISQLFAFGLTIFAAFSLLLFGQLLLKNSLLEEKLDKVLIKNSYFFFISFFLAVVGFGVLITPTHYLLWFSGYFESIRYLLFVLCILPMQYFIFRFGIKRFIEFPQQNKLLRSMLIVVLLVGLLLLFVNITKLGITPDPKYWNMAGIPLTTLQLIAISLAAMFFVAIGGYLRKRSILPSMLVVDICIIVSLYLITLFLWQNAPMPRNQFSLRPSWPSFQPFPASDSRIYDLGAISINKGWGISFGYGAQAPLYLIFLSGIRVLAGDNYFLQGDLQIAFLSLISPAMYLFGKRFHSRTFGLVGSLIILIRQYNSIVLAGTIVTATNAREFMTEVPTLFGLLVVSWIVFDWLKKPIGANSSALMAGGALVATCLIRLSPILLVPVFLMVSLVVLWRHKREWLLQASIFSVAFTFVLGAWFVAGRDSENQPYLVKKFYQVINTRYDWDLNPINQQINPDLSFSSNDGLNPSGIANPPFADAAKFPLFVINHSLHNLIGSFLYLPDSFTVADQGVENLTLRPYWEEVQNKNWRGELSLGQIPMVIVNIFMFSYGVAWSWKRWKWAGMVPLLIFLTYSLSVGLARTSGSRYLIPIDWVVSFYYAIALVFMLNLFLRPIKPKFVSLFKKAAVGKDRFSLIITSVLLISLFVIIIFAENWVKPEDELCNPQNHAAIAQQLGNASIGENWQFGEVLYPYKDERTLSFVLLTCKKPVDIEIQDFESSIAHGQMVVISGERLFSFDGSLHLIWEK